MTMLNERYSDLLAEDADPDTKILVHDLDAIFLIPAPPAVRTSTAAILMAQAAGPRSQPTRRRGFPTLRLAALAGAAALAMASMLAYMHQRLAPVSAETILRRAMAANTLPPNRTTHLVYAVAGQPRTPVM